MKIRAFITHKLKEEYSDCQDYFCINSDNRAIAVSDGVSQSIFPGWWAEILTNHFVEQPDWNFDSGIDKIQSQWQERVNEFVKQAEAKGRNNYLLKNMLAEKKGAGATLCGIQFLEGGKWEGYVLGDTSLIEISSNNEILDIHSTNEGGYGNYPDYFDSILYRKGSPKAISGTLNERANRLLIVSDPFAELLYKAKESDSDYKELLKGLLSVTNHEEYCLLVDEWREKKGLHNDDSTLVIVEFDNNSQMEIIHQDNLSYFVNKERNEITTEQVDIPDSSIIENKELLKK